MKKIMLIAMAVVSTLLVPAFSEPATAQIDWTGIKIDNDRIWQHQRRRANRNRRASPRTTVNGRRRSRESRYATPKAPERYPEVQVNGQRLKSPVAPVQVNGNTFVPFREIFEALGAKVSYNTQARLITAMRGSSRMQVSLPGGNRGKMRGKKENFDRGETPFIRQGVTMVPLRMVSEKMGAKVAYTPRPNAPLISIVGAPAPEASR